MLKAEYGKLPDLDAGRFRPRRAVHLERHHLGRARAQRRLDRRRSRRPHLRRRHLGGVCAADRLGQGRCAHLLLAEGAGRRGRARHADPVAARHRAAGELHAALADAEDLPPHQGRQAHRRTCSRARPSTRRRCCAWRTTSTRSAGPRASAACRRCCARADANAKVLLRLGRAARRGSRTWPSIRRRAPTPRCA